MAFPFPVPPGKLLYHPCCGNDLVAPLTSYAGRVDTFIFVDASRLPNWDRDRKAAPGALPGHLGYRRIAREVFGDQNARAQPRMVKAADNGQDMFDSVALEANSCVVQETFQSEEGRIVSVIRKRGCGLSTLNDLDGVDAFYYTGDSEGEGGSNLPLMRSPDQFWLPKMRKDGVVATDGSNDSSNNFKNWPRHPEASESAIIGATFSEWGRQFTCQRELGMKNGRVLEWAIEAIASCGA